jgi:hypothetical protein
MLIPDERALLRKYCNELAAGDQRALQALLYLLAGELMIGDRTLYPGDYNRAKPGTVDRRVWSETGCTCVLLTSFHEVLL